MNTSAPRVYRTLAEDAVQPNAAAYRTSTEIALQDVAIRLAKGATDAMHHAYLEGLRDGFQQGVQAEAEQAQAVSEAMIRRGGEAAERLWPGASTRAAGREMAEAVLRAAFGGDER